MLAVVLQTSGISNVLNILTLVILYIILVFIAVNDIRTRKIPVVLDILLALTGVMSVFTMPGPSILERVIGMFCISLPMILLDCVVHGAFGGGDIKVMAAAGLLLGWKANIVAFCIAILSGGIYAAVLLIRKKTDKKDHFPFAPFLSIGIAASAFCGCGTYVFDRLAYMVKTVFSGI